MNLAEVKKTLDSMFMREAGASGRCIVFWYDADSEFVNDIDDLLLDNAKLVKLGDNNSFQVKYLLEKQEPESNFLIYSSAPKPEPKDDWLLDVLNYSEEFSTDKAQLIMRELGVKDESLKPLFREYMKFFNNKERYRRIVSYDNKIVSADALHAAVLSALCKLPVVDFEQVLKLVICSRLEGEPDYVEAIEAYGNMDAFWSLVEQRYGYSPKEKTLEKLTIMLLTTHFANVSREQLPKSWLEYVSPRQSDCVVFVSHFMNHAADGKKYDALSDRVEGLLHLDKHLSQWELDKLLEADTFRGIDKLFINRITEHLVGGVNEFEKYKRALNARRKSRWFVRYSNDYDSLLHALLLLEFEQKTAKLIKGQKAHEFIETYTRDYYKVDYFYRKFLLSYDGVDNKDLLADLAEKVENTYTNWFLNELSIKWSAAVQEEMLDIYPVPSIRQQKDFYSEYISPLLREDERVFVIVSDALRYETGKELLELLNKELRGAATIEHLQGVVPSTTKFGMASLLPREKIEVNESADVLVDGINTQGTDNRSKILGRYSKDALAISSQNMADMKRSDYRETFEKRKLIYIYHNTIDAIGDKAATEREVFMAVEKALNEILILVRNLVNHVSAINIFITADHGFIYRRSPLTEVDKIGKQGIQAIDSGRRYLLCNSEDTHDDTLSISMSYLLGKETSLRAVVPKGLIRFKLPGSGANFVHGGVSLQEIVVPVIKFKNIRKDTFKASKVEVKLTSISRKITNRITFLEFFQKDLVSEKKLPLQLKVYFEDETGNRISNENIIIADSKSKTPQDRSYREKFTLRDLAYDKTKKYYLVMEDEGEAVERIYERIPFSIDLLISEDLGF